MSDERNEAIEVGERKVAVSNLDKVLFPGEGITKGDLIDYYRRIAEVMLPHLRDRPLTMHRFPDGLAREGFYQKEVSEHFPGWIERVAVEKKGGEVTHVLCNDATTLVYLANQAVVTPHVWLSRADRPRRPDRLVFDLDPPERGEGGFALVKDGARAVRGALEALELPCFLMTTGSRGLHVVVPLRRERDFDDVRAFARSVAELVAGRDPDRFTVAQRKDKRAGRLYVDFMRNGYAQTAVAPYAVRARPGAPVATPLEWNELGRRGLSARSWDIGNIFRRLGQKQDPWREISERAASLGAPVRRLRELRKDEKLDEHSEGDRTS